MTLQSFDQNMTESTFISLFAVPQSTTNVDAQVAFYKAIGFVVDSGYTNLEEIPDVYFTARGVSKSSLTKTVALRLPNDPYMHLILYGWKDVKTSPRWPAPFDQAGSRGLTLLVKDVDAELARIRAGWPHLRVLHTPLTIARTWGATTTALLADPEGVFVELLPIAAPSAYDDGHARPPDARQRSWLHCMMCCENFGQTRAFYEAFGLVHDHGVDFRPRTGFHPWGFAHFNEQMRGAFGFDLEGGGSREVAFLWNENDCSQMHLELLDYPEGRLKPPGPVPTWMQHGIARFCIRTKDYAGALKKAKEKGTKIFIEDQRGCLNWGDSQWFFFGDVDGNIVTLEEWFPHREWGEKR